jgi:hypothetical protein
MTLIPTPAVIPKRKSGSVSATVPGRNPSPGSSGSTDSGSEWQHLLVRIAEFIVGVALVGIGIQAIVVKSKPTQTILQTSATVAKVVK